MKKDSMSATLVAELKNDIIMGRMKAGDKLLPLRELAEQHGVSRSVVNSAVSTLAAHGYVRIVPRHHIVITDYLTTGSLGVVGDVIRSDNQVLKRKLAQDTLTLRMLLTVESVKAIASNPRISLTPLQKILNHEQAWLTNPIKDYGRFWKLDQLFHETIIELGENHSFRLLYRNFRYIAEGIIVMFFHNLDFITSLIEKQQTLINAMKSRDEKVAQAVCRDLLNAGAAETLKYYK
ncbi:MAG: GntR family transcriptional regulator [bacterium]